MYSTEPLISHLGSEYFPWITVFLRSVGLGDSSKLPFGRSPEERGRARLRSNPITKNVNFQHNRFSIFEKNP